MFRAILDAGQLEGEVKIRDIQRTIEIPLIAMSKLTVNEENIDSINSIRLVFILYQRLTKTKLLYKLYEIKYD